MAGKRPKPLLRPPLASCHGSSSNGRGLLLYLLLIVSSILPQAQPSTAMSVVTNNNTQTRAIPKSQLNSPPDPSPPPRSPFRNLVHLSKLNTNNSSTSRASSQRTGLDSSSNSGSMTAQIERRVTLGENFCTGSTSRLSSGSNKTEHYLKLSKQYKGCNYVEGNLEITWIERNADLSFLESIREITGYLLIAYVEVEHIKMPNLQIIRGRDLFEFNNKENNKEEFAMILIENKLKTLQLPNLREILAGSAGFYNNNYLCHVRNINWEEILWAKYKSIFIYENGTEPVGCAECSSKCPGACWAEGPNMCQKISKINCAPQCAGSDSGSRCFGPNANECCHAYCVGGCVGPKQSDCLACKNFYNDGECIQECPPMNLYNPSKFVWEPNPIGKYAFGANCVKECPDHLLRDNGACVITCPPNKYANGTECVPCTGACPKSCKVEGEGVVHSGMIGRLSGCTVIEGSITIGDHSFTGYAEAYNHGLTMGPHHGPMHPDRLEVFKTVREITGYLEIQGNHRDFKNLSCFRNLQVIGGRRPSEATPTLHIFKTSLVSLNLMSLRKIRAGKVIIEENKELCFAETIDWSQIINTTKSSSDDIIMRNNRDSSTCRYLGYRCHSQCGYGGCWGPGQDECLTCSNYKIGDYCVENCNSTQALGFLSYDAGNRTCKRCHSECKHGCNGTETQHCWSCKNLKDGQSCVSKCPNNKYRDGGTCEECDKSCAEGCTGPSNKLGYSGCNSCGKAVILNASSNHSLSTYCIQSDEVCPDGFYQEYVGSKAEDLLRSSIGRPICRKCNIRCESCTGPGAHVDVCKCSKYTAGEQCEDTCPRDFYPVEQSRKCQRCAPQCSGCYGPTEADCIRCASFRIYLDSNGPKAEARVAPSKSLLDVTKTQVQFNCTTICPPSRPHIVFDSLSEPYCSDKPLELDSSVRRASWDLFSIFLMLISTVGFIACVFIYRCQNEKDKTVKLTMRLSGFEDQEPLNKSNMKPNLAPLRSIKETELRIGRQLGSGFGGTVYQGTWYPEGHEHKDPKPVAIKFLRDNGESNMHKEFLDEAYIMASVNHPNLVRLLAVCMTPTQFMLVTQLMPVGCLLEYVRDEKNEIGAKNLLEWSKQIAKGMAYLEERRMVHRDLALRNVLLQTSKKALISDFGLAKFLEVDQSEYHSGGGRLPIKWLAPECIWERKFTHKSDVWAFGVTIWELLTFGRKPFEKIDSKKVPEEIKDGARLEQPKNTSTEVYLLMMSCWMYDPQCRPDFKSLAAAFVRFASDPERYLTVGSQDVRYNSDQEVMNDPEMDESEAFEEYNDDDLASVSEQELQPHSALPNLASPGHNRASAEVFSYELRHHSESSEVVSHNQVLSTPTFKKNGLFHGGGQQFIDENSLTHGPSRASTTLITDINNNDGFNGASSKLNMNADSWSSVHNTHSSKSIGQKSEQPTDLDDYLLPSPCSNEVKFSKFLENHKPRLPPVLPPLSRDPPHSAGLIGISNDEYFLTRASNYANATGSHGANASSGHIPHSLV